MDHLMKFWSDIMMEIQHLRKELDDSRKENQFLKSEITKMRKHSMERRESSKILGRVSFLGDNLQSSPSHNPTINTPNLGNSFQARANALNFLDQSKNSKTPKSIISCMSSAEKNAKEKEAQRRQNRKIQGTYSFISGRSPASFRPKKKTTFAGLANENSNNFFSPTSNHSKVGPLLQHSKSQDSKKLMKTCRQVISSFKDSSFKSQRAILNSPDHRSKSGDQKKAALSRYHPSRLEGEKMLKVCYSDDSESSIGSDSRPEHGYQKATMEDIEKLSSIEENQVSVKAPEEKSKG